MLERARDRQREVRIAAGLRWRARTATRADNRDKVAENGPGSADSTRRQTEMSHRDQILDLARELGSRGQLPVFIERKIGPTLDFSRFPPSEAARRAGRPVARIVEVRGPDVEPSGFATGFLIAPGLLITNHHVLPSLADTRGVAANFLYEENERGVQRGLVFELDPATFFINNKTLDFAIVALKHRSLEGHVLDELGVLTLVEATPKALIGDPVNIIQHPEGRSKQYATIENRLIDILDAGFLHYETDTLQGSSGSPAFSRNWEIVALHHTAVPAVVNNEILTRDGGIWREGMDDDEVLWVANEGVRVSSIVKSLVGLRLNDPAQQAILEGLIATTSDPVLDLAHALAANPALGAGVNRLQNPMAGLSGGAGMANNQFTFTGPVTIHIYAPEAPALGIGVGARPAITSLDGSAPRPEITAPEKTIRFDPDKTYANRKGYDPHFLDPVNKTIVVPTPGIDPARLPEILVKDGKPYVLKYHNYELVMNKTRRLQMWSAVNVEYDPAKKTKRSANELGKDKWIDDPRIDPKDQLLEAEFYKPAKQIDLGHMVRRQDNAWGDSEEAIEFANSDSYHLTNATPQHMWFNQSNAQSALKGAWGDLENHIQKQLTGVETRACILAGPIHSPDDPSADFGKGPITYPLDFWKVIAVATKDAAGALTLKVFGFILSQKTVVEQFGIERFDPGTFASDQVSLARITERSGVTFDQALHDADPLRTAPGLMVSITSGPRIQGF